MLKTLSLFKLLENKAMEMSSMRVGNKNKHQFATKACEIVKGKRVFNS